MRRLISLIILICICSFLLGANRVAHLVVSVGSPTTSESNWHTYIQGRSYVDTIVYWDVNSATADSLNTYTWVLMSNECCNDELTACTIWRDLTVPLVFQGRRCHDTLAFGDGHAEPGAALYINITDNTHEITDRWATGDLQVINEIYYMAAITPSGSMGDINVLAHLQTSLESAPHDSFTVAALEAGGDNDDGMAVSA